MIATISKHATWPAWIASGDWAALKTAVPILPAAVGHVMSLALDPDVSVAPLTYVISRDQVLATRVLRLANSAHSGPLEEIASINQATMRIGTAAVRNVVLAVCLSSRLPLTPGGETQRDAHPLSLGASDNPIEKVASSRSDAPARSRSRRPAASAEAGVGERRSTGRIPAEVAARPDVAVGAAASSTVRQGIYEGDRHANSPAGSAAFACGLIRSPARIAVVHCRPPRAHSRSPNTRGFVSTTCPASPRICLNVYSFEPIPTRRRSSTRGVTITADSPVNVPIRV
jgi:hypothetical protein